MMGCNWRQLVNDSRCRDREFKCGIEGVVRTEFVGVRVAEVWRCEISDIVGFG